MRLREFGDIDKEIKIQLVEKCTSARVRRNALLEEISLEDFLKYSRTMETSDRQIGQFESLHQSGIKVNNLDAPQSCFVCGGNFPHPQGRASCLASRKTSVHCGKLGHFAQVCKMTSGASRNRMPLQTTSSEGARHKSRNSVNTVDVPESSIHQPIVSFSDSDDDEFVFTVEGTTTTSPKKQPIAKIAMKDVPVRNLVGCGATVNMLEGNFKRRWSRRTKLLSPRFTLPINQRVLY